jgi:hypothetical protein
MRLGGILELAVTLATETNFIWKQKLEIKRLVSRKSKQAIQVAWRANGWNLYSLWLKPCFSCTYSTLMSILCSPGAPISLLFQKKAGRALGPRSWMCFFVLIYSLTRVTR